MAKVLKTLRSNWKKSLFFASCTAYGLKYCKGLYEDSVLRTAYCLKAQEYGALTIKSIEKPRRVTVFLNPAANWGKGKKLFDKNVAPLLHLAGMEVTLMKTEYDGQAKKYMEVIEDTDAIIVAGGDGTLLEVVTGLMKRADQNKYPKIPIGVIPIGKTNSFANKLIKKDDDKSLVWWLSESALSIVMNSVVEVDVMEIRGKDEKTVYAVSNIEYGPFRDTKLKAKDYWYLGPFKSKYVYMRDTIGLWPPTVRAKLCHVLNCEGCSKCYTPPAPITWRWWHVLLPPKRTVPKVDYSNVVNEECGNINYQERTTFDISCNCNQNISANKPSSMTIDIGPEYMSKSEFIAEGFNRVNRVDSANCTRIEASKFAMQPDINEDEATWFSIDSEDFEAMNIDVALLKKRLRVFYPFDSNSVM